MNKLSKITLNAQGKVLQKDEMLKILGGGSWYCYRSDGYYLLITANTIDECDSICKREMSTEFASCR